MTRSWSTRLVLDLDFDLGRAAAQTVVVEAAVSVVSLTWSDEAEAVDAGVESAAS